MDGINKPSLREEFDTVTAPLERLGTEVKPCPRGQVQTQRCFLADRQDAC